MLDSTRARIGNPEYARQNSFGLSTLRNRHVKFIRDGRALLRFRGKGGVQHEIVVDDKRLARLVRRCHELPGQQLFQYIDDDGQRCPVGSVEVNDYLREVMGGEFTAKDFRTWGATTRTVVLLSRMPLPPHPSDRACNRRIASVVQRVAKELHNTPAVCRKVVHQPGSFRSVAFWTLAARLEGETVGPDFRKSGAENPFSAAESAIDAVSSAVHSGRWRRRHA